MATDFQDSEVGHDNLGFSKESLRENAQINERTGDRARVERSQSEVSTSGNNKPSDDKEVDDTVDLSCGIWKFRTNIFGRKFSNLYVFIICVGLSTFFTVIVQSTFQIQLTSMQRQFGIDNAQTGLFETASRIGSLSTILFAGHFAKKANIPVVVGLAGVIQGLIFMVPAFIQLVDPYTLPDISNGTSNTENDKYVCNIADGNGTDQNTTLPDQTNKVAFNILVGVQAIKGITDAFHVGFLPTLYVDDNTLDKSKMGIIFGIQTIISTLAYPIGKQINAFFTKIPIDLKTTTMDPQDERFVAAWWLSFLIFGGLTVIFSIPVMLFPKKLVSNRQQAEALQKAMVSFANGGMGNDENDEEGPQDEEVKSETPRASTKRGNSPTQGRRYSKHSLAPVNSNPIGIVDTTSYGNRRRSSVLPALQGPSERRISVDGKVIFEQPIKERSSVAGGESVQGSSNLISLLKDFPKAIYRVFRRPVFTILVVDIFIFSIPLAGLGMFRTAYVTYEYNVSMADAATLTAVTQVVAQVIGTFISGYLANKVKSKRGFALILIGTHLIALAVTPIFLILGCDNQLIHGHEGFSGIHVNATEKCGCVGTDQLLACGDDGNNYLSPCYAGCESYEGKTFTLCSGLEDSNNKTMNVMPGLCPSDCRTNYLVYVTLHAVQQLSWLISNIPFQLLILRMVDPRDRGFGTSIFTFFSTIASIPAPNIFGRVIDGTCLIWKGSYCSLYDRDKIRYLLSGSDIAVSGFIQITIFTMTYLLSREENVAKKKLQEEKKAKEKLQEEKKAKEKLQEENKAKRKLHEEKKAKLKIQEENRNEEEESAINIRF